MYVCNAWTFGTLMCFGTFKRLCEGHHCRLLTETSHLPRLGSPLRGWVSKYHPAFRREDVAGLCLMDCHGLPHSGNSPVVKFGWANFHQLDGVAKSKSGTVQVKVRSMNNVAHMSVTGCQRQTAALANTPRTQDRLMLTNDQFCAPNISKSLRLRKDVSHRLRAAKEPEPSRG